MNEPMLEAPSERVIFVLFGTIGVGVVFKKWKGRGDPPYVSGTRRGGAGEILKHMSRTKNRPRLMYSKNNTNFYNEREGVFLY